MLWDRIYNINAQTFDPVAMEVFYFQAEYNALYQEYLTLIKVKPESVQNIHDIPFLPIQFFKNHVVKTGNWDEQTIFESSRTTGQQPSRHYVRELDRYRKATWMCFPKSLGFPDNYTWVGLLPSYLERQSSSLVNMVQYFMQQDKHQDGFFTQMIDQQLANKLSDFAKESRPVILVGVTFALLDLFEKFRIPVWPELLVIETGGMKGREREMTRMEVYDRLLRNHSDLQLKSEYGMTELFSQAYGTNSVFQCGPTMRIFIREINDPFNLLPFQKRGGINVMDLANLDTCSFIATDDAGLQENETDFQIMGRLDASEVRGCNLMYQG